MLAKNQVMPTDSTVSIDAVIDRPSLHIRLLGECSLTYGREVVQSVASPRLQSVLAFIILHRSGSQSRRHLAFTLWPDSTESQARTNLRRELHNLRQALPAAEEFLSVGTQTLQWRSGAPFTLDVAAFEQAVSAAHDAAGAGDDASQRAALAEAVALYKGDLLPGCYDDWLLAERQRLRQAYLHALEQLVGLLQRQRDYRAAIDYAQQLLREDPLAEEAYRYLIRLYAANGDRARALRVYHTCVTTLQRELGVEPGADTRQAYEALLHAATPPPPQHLPQTGFAGTTPLVGRQEEWQRLLSCWRQAAAGHSQSVVMLGEAGIGKTRLLEELVAWAGDQGIITAQTRCYPFEGGLAYAPVSDWLRAVGLRAEVQELDGVWLTQVARLLPELLAEQPNLTPPQPITESWQRQHFFEALARAIFALRRPLLLVVDDLQWAGEETLAWLHYLLRYTPQSPLLLAATIRSTEIDPAHPVAPWLTDLRRTDQLAEIELGPLDEAETALLAAHVAGSTLNSDLAARLYAETEGHPLFIVETIRAGDLAAAFTHGAALPPKLQAVIESRLARLSAQARRLANLAAAIGRAFTFDVLAAASAEDEDWLVQGLDELWQQRLIREQSDQDYDFSHNKIREAVYTGLSAANRRLLHRRIATAMEQVYAAHLDPASKEIARQYELAGVAAKAIAYYRRAGQVAQEIYANADAIQLYEKALSLLHTLPASREHAAQELTLQRQLAIAHRNTKGYAANEVGLALNRARQLSLQLEGEAAIAPILWGLYTFNFVRADLRQAHSLGEELFALAHAQQNPALRQQAHNALGGTLSSLGELEQALHHFEHGITLYDASQHPAQVAMFGVDLGVFCQAWSAHALWYLGHLDQARQRSQASVASAAALGHPFSQALAMAYATMLSQFSRDSRLVKESAEATLEFCTRHDIGYYNHWATILHGWALVDQGELQSGIDQMQNGLARFRDSHSETRLPYYLTLLAQAYSRVGQRQKGLEQLDEALAIAAKNDDIWYNAETHRLRGDLLLQAGDPAQAELSYQNSLNISRRQKAKTLALRTTVSLARLRLAQKQPEEARAMLGEIYARFSEGFDTADLQAARKLLDELS